ncbi:hypothetical protein BJV74DRAFT_987946 [Russula compacta]|nr:hypothetical protein BJV74DRAFT_987946 [Russula compacta]
MFGDGQPNSGPQTTKNPKSSQFPRSKVSRRHVDEDFWSAHMGASTFAYGDITFESSCPSQYCPRTREKAVASSEKFRSGGQPSRRLVVGLPQHGVGDTDGWDAGTTLTCVGAKWTETRWNASQLKSEDCGTMPPMLKESVVLTTTTGNHGSGKRKKT